MMCWAQPISRRYFLTGSGTRLILSVELSAEIPFAFVWFETCANNAVPVECDKRPTLTVETGYHTISPHCLDDGSNCRAISQSLCRQKILFKRNIPKLSTMFM